MQLPDCLLTLTFPHALEDRVLGFVTTHDAQRHGFVCSEVSARGENASYAAPKEKVRGMDRQLQVTLALSQEDAQRLLDDLRQQQGLPGLTYWLVPLMTYRRLS